jgi:hypothetical protein
MDTYMVLTLLYNGEKKRAVLQDLDQLSYDSVKQLSQNLFVDLDEAFHFKYFKEENNEEDIWSDREFGEAMRQSYITQNPLQLVVVKNQKLNPHCRVCPIPIKPLVGQLEKQLEECCKMFQPKTVSTKPIPCKAVHPDSFAAEEDKLRKRSKTMLEEPEKPKAAPIHLLDQNDSYLDQITRDLVSANRNIPSRPFPWNGQLEEGYSDCEELASLSEEDSPVLGRNLEEDSSFDSRFRKMNEISFRSRDRNHLAANNLRELRVLSF